MYDALVKKAVAPQELSPLSTVFIRGTCSNSTSFYEDINLLPLSSSRQFSSPTGNLYNHLLLRMIGSGEVKCICLYKFFKDRS